MDGAAYAAVQADVHQTTPNPNIAGAQEIEMICISCH